MSDDGQAQVAYRVPMLSALRGVPRPLVLGSFALAVFQVVGTIGASRNQQAEHTLDALAIAIAVVGPLALMLLTLAPRAVIVFIAATIVVYLWRGYAYGPVFAGLAIAAAAVVARGHRLAAWLAMAGALLGFLAVHALVRDESWSWAWGSGVAAWSLLVLLVGEVVRIRRERVVASRRARRESDRRHANEERLQIARELHDVVAHHLSLINVQAGVALHIVDRRPEQARTALEAIKDASKDALVELRSLVGVLRDADDEAPRRPRGTLASLDDLVARSAHAGLMVNRSVEGRARPLSSAVELAALRIVQEAVTNVVRHAGAQRADIVLEYAPGSLVVVVEDDGRGMVAGREGGAGLAGMQERAEALGGSLEISAGAAGGVHVKAVLPTGGER